MIWGLLIIILIIIMIVAAVSGIGSLVAVEFMFNPIVGIVVICITAIIITKIICRR